MSAEITFEWDSRDLSIWRGGQIEKALARALRLAGNQAIRDMQRGASAFALSKKRLGSAIIAEDQSLSLPRGKTEIRDFVWKLWVKGKPVPVSKFPHVDTRRNNGGGVLVRFGAGGTQRIKSAFVARTRSGHVGVFQRTGKARLPIKEAFSSRLPRRFGEGVMLSLGDKTYRKLETAFTRGLDRELGKLKRKGEP